jgi:hypothetical protein
MGKIVLRHHAFRTRAAERIGYDLSFGLSALVYLTAAGLWFFIDATRPVAGQLEEFPGPTACSSSSE